MNEQIQILGVRNPHDRALVEEFLVSAAIRFLMVETSVIARAPKRFVAIQKGMAAVLLRVPAYMGNWLLWIWYRASYPLHALPKLKPILSLN